MVRSENSTNRNPMGFGGLSHVWISILDKRPDLDADVAMNKQLPASIIDRLILNGCARARALVAIKRALTDEQFCKLAIDDDESIRNIIANNKKAPLKILEQLADDECDLVSNSAKARLLARAS